MSTTKVYKSTRQTKNKVLPVDDEPQERISIKDINDLDELYALKQVALERIRTSKDKSYNEYINITIKIKRLTDKEFCNKTRERARDRMRDIYSSHKSQQATPVM